MFSLLSRAAAAVFTASEEGLPEQAHLSHDVDSVRASFAFFDTDGSDSLTVDEFAMMLGPGFSSAEVRQVVREVDTDGSGAVSLDEYMAWLLRPDPNSPLRTGEIPASKTPASTTASTAAAAAAPAGLASVADLQLRLRANLANAAAIVAAAGVASVANPETNPDNSSAAADASLLIVRDALQNLHEYLIKLSQGKLRRPVRFPVAFKLGYKHKALTVAQLDGCHDLVLFAGFALTDNGGYYQYQYEPPGGQVGGLGFGGGAAGGEGGPPPADSSSPQDAAACAAAAHAAAGHRLSDAITLVGRTLDRSLGGSLGGGSSTESVEGSEAQVAARPSSPVEGKQQLRANSSSPAVSTSQAQEAVPAPAAPASRSALSRWTSGRVQPAPRSGRGSGSSSSSSRPPQSRRSSPPRRAQQPPTSPSTSPPPSGAALPLLDCNKGSIDPDAELGRLVVILAGTPVDASTVRSGIPGRALYERLAGVPWMGGVASQAAAGGSSSPSSPKRMAANSATVALPPKALGMMKWVKCILAMDPVPTSYKEELKEKLSDATTGNAWLASLSGPKFAELRNHSRDQLGRISADLRAFYGNHICVDGDASGQALCSFTGGPVLPAAAAGLAVTAFGAGGGYSSSGEPVPMSPLDEVVRQNDYRCGPFPSPPQISSSKSGGHAGSPALSGSGSSGELAFKAYIIDFMLLVAGHVEREYRKEMYGLFGDATQPHSGGQGVGQGEFIGGRFTGCANKRYERCAGKFRSKEDHGLRDDPKGACNIDVVRGCAVFPDSGSLLDGVHQVQSRMRTARIKNAFHRNNDASAAFEYRALLLNAIMEVPSVTWGNIADEMVARVSDNSTANAAHASSSAPLGVTKQYRDLVTSAAEWIKREGFSALPIRMVVEVQFTVDYYMQSRKRSHLPYQVFRADDPRNLADDFKKGKAAARAGADKMRHSVGLLRANLGMFKHSGASGATGAADRGAAEAGGDEDDEARCSLSLVSKLSLARQLSVSQREAKGMSVQGMHTLRLADVQGSHQFHSFGTLAVDEMYAVQTLLVLEGPTVVPLATLDLSACGLRSTRLTSMLAEGIRAQAEKHNNYTIGGGGGALTSLNLSRNGMSSDALLPITDVIGDLARRTSGMGSLSSLDLSDNRLMSKGFEHIAAMLNGAAAAAAAASCVSTNGGRNTSNGRRKQQRGGGVGLPSLTSLNVKKNQPTQGDTVFRGAISLVASLAARLEIKSPRPVQTGSAASPALPLLVNQPLDESLLVETLGCCRLVASKLLNGSLCHARYELYDDDGIGADSWMSDPHKAAVGRALLQESCTEAEHSAHDAFNDSDLAGCQSDWQEESGEEEEEEEADGKGSGDFDSTATRFVSCGGWSLEDWEDDVDLSGQVLNGPGDGTLLAGALRRNDTVTSLDISRSGLGPACGHAFAYALRDNAALRHLSLAQNCIRPEGASALSQLLKHPRADGGPTLTSLDVSFNSLGAAGVVAIAAGLECGSGWCCGSALRRLSLAGNGAREEGVLAVACLLSSGKCPTSLTQLDVSDNACGARAATALAKALLLPGKEEEEEEERREAEVENTSKTNYPKVYPCVADVDVSGNLLFCEGAVAWAKVVASSPHLASLNLSNNRLGLAAAAPAVSTPATAASPVGRRTASPASASLRSRSPSGGGSGIRRVPVSPAFAGASSPTSPAASSATGRGSAAAAKQATAAAAASAQDDTGLMALAAALCVNGGALASLNLSRNGISQGPAVVIAGALRTQRHRWRAVRAGLGPGSSGLGGGAAVAGLTSLNLGDNQIRAAGAEALADALCSSGVDSDSGGGGGGSSEDEDDFDAPPAALAELVLSNNEIGSFWDDGLYQLSSSSNGGGAGGDYNKPLRRSVFDVSPTISAARRRVDTPAGTAALVRLASFSDSPGVPNPIPSLHLLGNGLHGIQGGAVLLGAMRERPDFAELAIEMLGICEGTRQPPSSMSGGWLPNQQQAATGRGRGEWVSLRGKGLDDADAVLIAGLVQAVAAAAESEAGAAAARGHSESTSFIRPVVALDISENPLLGVAGGQALAAVLQEQWERRAEGLGGNGGAGVASMVLHTLIVGGCVPESSAAGEGGGPTQLGSGGGGSVGGSGGGGALIPVGDLLGYTQNDTCLDGDGNAIPQLAYWATVPRDSARLEYGAGNALGPEGAVLLAQTLSLRHQEMQRLVEASSTVSSLLKLAPLSHLVLQGANVGFAGAGAIGQAVSELARVVELQPAADCGPFLLQTLTISTAAAGSVDRDGADPPPAAVIPVAALLANEPAVLDFVEAPLGVEGAVALAPLLLLSPGNANNNLSEIHVCDWSRCGGGAERAMSRTGQRRRTAAANTRMGLGSGGGGSSSSANAGCIGLEGGRVLAEVVRNHPCAQSIANASFAYGRGDAGGTKGGAVAVDVSQNGLDVGQALLLAALLEKATTVTSLDAAFNSLGPDSTLLLARSAAVGRSVTALDLSGNDTGSAGCVRAAVGCWPEGLTKLALCYNQIRDVSQLSLPPGLKELDLSSNQIADVSQLTLPEGLEVLDLSGNHVADMSQLTLPKGCELREAASQ